MKLAKMLPLLLASIFPLRTFAAYSLVQDYTGANFYEGFEFFTEPDPTDGHVQFLSMEDANNTAIAGMINGGNASMAVYLGVDSTDVAPNGRNSVRVSSTQSFNHALVIVDIAHMPGGVCGTWPAFWMVGPNWPNDGEIDIIEGVNDQATNAMTLHTNAGLVVQNISGIQGSMETSNCDVNAPDQAQNAGCSIVAESGLTFGAGFNAASGGVYATEWTSDQISTWFFPRGSTPSDITAGTPNPSTESWGAPASLFQGDSGVNLDEHFTNLSIIFDTTFCGQWAGAVWSSSPTCSQLADTCEDYVTSQPAAFAEAYWAINSLQVFQDPSQGNTSTPISRRAGKRQSDEKIRGEGRRRRLRRHA